jgi:serine/threonine protein kinase
MDDSLIGQTLGEYEILERVGKGGMGLVYKARQISLDRVVAIKVLPPEMCADEEYVDRFLREARAAAHLNHPNIIQIFDAGVANDTYFFVMEFVDGKNLIQILREEGVFREQRALRIVKDTAIGLTFAHQMGVVHRDVKPENIMVTQNGVVKIGDLGLAKYKSQQMDASLTSAGMTMGTPFYIAPEQIRGMKDIDARADIYALGMSLYHILEGRPAFGKGSGAEIMAQHLSDPVPPIERADISVGMRELITAMTMKNRDERLQDMSDVALGVAKMLGEELPHTIAARAVGPAVQKAKKEEKSLLVMILFLVTIILLVAGFIVYKLVNKKTDIVLDHPEAIPQQPSSIVVPAPTESVPAKTAEATPPPNEEANHENSSGTKPETSSRPNRPFRVRHKDLALVPKSEAIPSDPLKAESKPPEAAPKEASTEAIPPPQPSSETTPSSESIVAETPKEETQTASLDRQILKGPNMIRDTTIYFGRDQLPFVKYEDGKYGAVNLIFPSIEKNVTLQAFQVGKGDVQREMGKALGQQYRLIVASYTNDMKRLVESRALIKLNIVGSDREKAREFAEKILKVEKADLRLMVEGVRSNTDMTLTIRRVLKNWGAARPEYKNTRTKMGVSDQVKDYSRFLSEYDAETTWEYSSRSKWDKWYTPGASHVGRDIEPSNETRERHITGGRGSKSIMFNVLPDLQNWAKGILENREAIQDPGWLIQCVNGSGEISFSPTELPSVPFGKMKDTKLVPALILQMKKEESAPLTDVQVDESSR